jgi:hypothetical protein
MKNLRAGDKIFEKNNFWVLKKIYNDDIIFIITIIENLHKK